MNLPKHFTFGFVSLCLLITCMDGYDKCVASIRRSCPDTWSQWDGKCYKKLPVNLPWAEAREECIKMGSALVMPQSQEETEFIVNNKVVFFWINCNDLRVEGSWDCEDDRKLVQYTNRKAGESSNSSDQDCAWQQTSGAWNDTE
ncbi:perlucin-like protein [Acanthaster planci]|uniref:Perlucin-like protein n=1 Tax=Acanthaster planci TaxID=133434 RepID=A0A8B7ZQY8_ACAPL|nr:perlucin-like protein [Acanthaster planci]